MLATVELSAKRKSGRPVRRESLEAAKEMARLLDGKPATMRSLAIACGLDVSTISRRVEVARQAMEPHEQWSPSEPDEELNADDLSYFERRYRDSSDPDIREFLNSIRTPLRRRP